MDVVSRKILLRKRMYVFGSTGVSKQRNNENLGQNEKKTIVYEPKRFLNDGPVKKSAVWSKFCRLIVSLFFRVAIETEEASRFQNSKFQTLPATMATMATIATITMGTRPTQPKYVIEAQCASQIFG